MFDHQQLNDQKLRLKLRLGSWKRIRKQTPCEYDEFTSFSNFSYILKVCSLWDSNPHHPIARQARLPQRHHTTA